MRNDESSARKDESTRTPGKLKMTRDVSKAFAAATAHCTKKLGGPCQTLPKSCWERLLGIRLERLRTPDERDDELLQQENEA